MPRVSIKNKDYKLKDLKGWIVMQMKLNGLKQEDVAKALGITQGPLSMRLKIKDSKDGKVSADPFSYGDMLTLCELFKVSDEEKQRLLTL